MAMFFSRTGLGELPTTEKPVVLQYKTLFPLLSCIWSYRKKIMSWGVHMLVRYHHWYFSFNFHSIVFVRLDFHCNIVQYVFLNHLNYLITFKYYLHSDIPSHVLIMSSSDLQNLLTGTGHSEPINIHTDRVYMYPLCQNDLSIFF